MDIDNADPENEINAEAEANMTDEEKKLLMGLKAEEEQSVAFWQSEIQTNQRQAMEQYYGQLYGDEEEGRSQMITREVFETIEWIRPDLVDMFTASDRVVTLEPGDPLAENHVEVAQAYLNHVFFQKHNGLNIIDQFAFDGLLQKLGIAAVYVDEEYGDLQEYEGLSTPQYQAVVNSPNVEEIVDEEVEEVEASEFYPDGMSYEVKVRTKSKKCLRFDNVAPEDFRVSARSTTLDDANYKARVHRMSRHEAMKRFPEKAALLDNYPETDDIADWDERRDVRFVDEEDYDDLKSKSSKSSQELHVYEEYLFWDLDEDENGSEDNTKLYKVFRSQDLILEYEEVDDHPFADWCPIKIPHRLYGLSVYDITNDLQRANTVLLRAALDTTYQSVAPRMIVNEGKVNMNDLLDVSAGAVIRAQAAPSEVAMPLKTPSGAGDVLPILEKLDQMGESRTGVTRNAQGMDPDSLNKTATGIQLMQDAAAARKRMIARNFGSGVQKLLQKAYSLLVTQIDSQELFMFNNAWTPINPLEWSDKMNVIVDVGVGTGAREVHMQHLQTIMGMQEKWATTFGLNTPVVTPKHIHNTAEEVIRTMGYRSPSRFIGPVEQFQPQDPEPPVELQIAQMEAQAKQQEYQMKMQLEQMKMQNDQAKLENDKQVELAKIQQQAELKRLELQMEMDMKREQAAQELALKERIATAEMQLQAQKDAADIQANINTNVRPGGEPG
jgi:hypothetical protein